MDDNVSKLVLNFNTGMRILIMAIILGYTLWVKAWLPFAIGGLSILSLSAAYIFHWSQLVRIIIGTALYAVIGFYIVQTEASKRKKV